MSRKFRDWRPRDSWLFPPSPQDWLHENHLVYFLLDVVQKIDTSPMINQYDTGKGGHRVNAHLNPDNQNRLRSQRGKGGRLLCINVDSPISYQKCHYWTVEKPNE